MMTREHIETIRRIAETIAQRGDYPRAPLKDLADFCISSAEDARGILALLPDRPDPHEKRRRAIEACVELEDSCSDRLVKLGEALAEFLKEGLPDGQ